MIIITMTSDEAKAVLTKQQLQITTTISKPTTTPKEILIIPIESTTTTPAQNVTMTANNSCIKTVIENSIKTPINRPILIPNKINTITPTTIKSNTVLAALAKALR